MKLHMFEASGLRFDGLYGKLLLIHWIIDLFKLFVYLLLHPCIHIDVPLVILIRYLYVLCIQIQVHIHMHSE